jgi:hypothetical protein
MTIYKFSGFQILRFDFLLLCNKGKNANYEKENHSKGYQLACI